MNNALIKYIESAIFLIYEKHIQHHGLDHIKYVIRRSLDFANQVTDQTIDRDMVYTIAAFHDIGMVKNRDTHELVGAQMLLADTTLPQFFTPDQM